MDDSENRQANVLEISIKLLTQRQTKRRILCVHAAIHTCYQGPTGSPLQVDEATRARRSGFHFARGNRTYVVWSGLV